MRDFIARARRRTGSGTDFGKLCLGSALAFDRLELGAEAIQRPLRFAELTLRVADVSAEGPEWLANFFEGTREPRANVQDALRVGFDLHPSHSHADHLNVVVETVR